MPYREEKTESTESSVGSIRPGSTFLSSSFSGGDIDHQGKRNLAALCRNGRRDVTEVGASEAGASEAGCE